MSDSFDPSRECNILDKTTRICLRHGHSHSPYAIAPSPWRLSEKDGNITRDILDAEGATVCSIWNVQHPWLVNNKSTARLILGAPRLLEAALDAFDFLGGIDGAVKIRDELLAAINAASAEARSDATGTGAAEGESAAPQEDAHD
jgi:hypothetical protein